MRKLEQSFFNHSRKKYSIILYTLGVNDKIFAFSIQVHSFPLCFVLFCLRLYVPVNNLSVLSNGDEVSFLTSCPG